MWSDERQKYELRQHVCTPQLSTSAVASLTSSIAEHVTLLQHVHSFVDRRCHFSSTSGHCMQAFGHSLRAYLHSHDREVWRFESDVYAATSERLTTVLALTNHMQPHVQYVRMLHSVIQQFVSQSAAASTTAEEGSRLLSILYAQYEARSLLTDDISSALSLCLLLESLTPYIEQLDEVHTITTQQQHSTLGVYCNSTHLSALLCRALGCVVDGHRWTQWKRQERAAWPPRLTHSARA